MHLPHRETFVDQFEMIKKRKKKRSSSITRQHFSFLAYFRHQLSISGIALNMEPVIHWFNTSNTRHYSWPSTFSTLP